MKILRIIVSSILVLLSAYMVLEGLLIFINTSGMVQGTDFQMLITLANQLSLIMVWLALFAIRSVLPSGGHKAEKLPT